MRRGGRVADHLVRSSLSLGSDEQKKKKIKMHSIQMHVRLLTLLVRWFQSRLVRAATFSVGSWLLDIGKRKKHTKQNQ